MTHSDFDNGDPRSAEGSAHTPGLPEDSGSWLRSLVESSSEIVTVVDPDGTLRYASPAFGRALGYDPGEAVGTMNVLDHVHLDDLPLVLEETEKALSEGGVVTNRAEYRFRHRDGSWRWLESVGTYLLDDPAVGGVVVTSRDVTERREAEDALSRSEAEIFDVLESINDAFFALDREWRFSYVNAQAQALFDRRREDLIGERIWEDSTFYPQYRKAVAEGVTARFEAFYAPLGAWFSVRAYPSESGLSVYLQDVTERKEAEERLEAQYKNFPLPTYTWQRVGDDFVLVDHNEAAHEYSQGLVGDLLGSRATDLFGDSPDYMELVERCFRERSTTSRELPWRLLRSGETRRLVVTCVFVAPDMVMVHTEDVTERIAAEEKLRFQAQLLDVVGEAVIALDDEGRVLYWNRAAEGLYGWSAGEVMGRNLREMVVPEELVGRAAAITEEVKRAGSWTGEFEVRHKDGTLFPAECTNTPIYDDDDGLIGVIGVVRDISQRKKTEERLREAEERYRTLVERIPVVTFVDRADGSGEPVYVSPQVEAMLGYAPEEWTAGKLWRERLHPDDREQVLLSDERFNAHGEPVDEEYRLLAKDGSVVWVHEETVLVRGEGGEPLFVQGIMSDVTERKRAVEALRESEQRFRRSFDDAAVGMALVATDGRWLRVNRSLCEIVGYPQAELLDKTFQSITHPDDLEGDLDHVRRLLAGEVRTYEMEKRYLHKKGHVVWALLSVSLVRDEGGRPLYFVSQIQDITARKRMEEQLKRQALHDPLTGLPNRKLFVDRLGHALERTRRRKGRQVAILFMDLDGFKVVNDSLGHEAGDLLLVIVTERLRRCVRPEDMLARFGGDEFVVLLDDVGDPSEAIRVAGRIAEELSKPFVLDGRGLFTSASIGIAQGDARTSSAEDLLRDADTAMYRAKDEHADFRVFDLSMYERAVERLDAENDLRRAMGAGEFVVHYQPIVDLENGETWGVEALVRWNHPERGLLDPHEFVPVAEESGLVVPMGEALMEEACRRAREWREGDPQIPPFVLSVNLSARQLVRPDLAETVGGVLERTGFEGSSLSLDITETAYVRELEDNATSLDRLRDLGVGISIDDFGTGYSSLAYLKRLPAEALKLDRSFVKGLGLEAEDAAIARTIVDLAHIMGMKVVAEGVETLEQAVLLREMDCDYAQGYFFCRPLPSGEAAQFLAG